MLSLQCNQFNWYMQANSIIMHVIIKWFILVNKIMQVFWLEGILLWAMANLIPPLKWSRPLCIPTKRCVLEERLTFETVKRACKNRSEKLTTQFLPDREGIHFEGVTLAPCNACLLSQLAKSHVLNTAALCGYEET